MQRTGSIRRDDSKSTAEGEWEMRDGKWYRKDYFAVEQQVVAPPPPPPKKEPFVCRECPTHVQRITILSREIEELKRLLNERDRLIAELRARLEKWEIESRNWLAERERLIIRIRELEAEWAERQTWVHPDLIREKEMLIVQLEERIRMLLAEKESLLNKLAKLAVIIEDFEKQWKTCKARGFECNTTVTPLPAPVVVPMPIIVPAPQPVVEEVVHHVQPVMMRSVTRRAVPVAAPSMVYQAYQGFTGAPYASTYAAPTYSAAPTTVVTSVTRGGYYPQSYVAAAPTNIVTPTYTSVTRGGYFPQQYVAAAPTAVVTSVTRGGYYPQQYPAMAGYPFAPQTF